VDEFPAFKFEPKYSVHMNEVFVSFQSCTVCSYLCVQVPIFYEESENDQSLAQEFYI
jgi:hypothetical protein